MRLGVCTTDFPRMEAAKSMELCARLGFESAQVSFASFTETSFVEDGVFEIPYNVSGAAVRAIRDAAQNAGIALVSVNGTFNATHPDGALRGEGVARFEGFTDAVAALGCPYVSLCTGTRCADYLWRRHPDNDTPEAWRDMISVVRRLARIAERKNLILAVETEASNVVNSPEKARRMLDEIASPNLKMILDCANLFAPGQARRGNVDAVIDRAFACFGRDIVMAHGKDIREGDDIDFCATGEGIVDFERMTRRLREYGFDGDFLLHGVYDLEKFPEAVSFIRRYL